MRRISALLVAAGTLLVAAAPAPAAAQSIEEIFATATERHAAQLKDVQNIIMISEIMGTETRTFMEKEMVGGQPVLVPKTNTVNGLTVPLDGQTDWSTPGAQYFQLTEHATLQGREMVDGEETYVISVNDLGQFDFTPPGAETGEAPPYTVERMVMYVDTDEYVVRKMEAHGSMQQDGRAHPITTTMHFGDYRSVAGMQYPWRTTIASEGMMDAGQISSEDRERAQKQFAELEKQIESMPAEQRKMMEEMLGGQLGKLRRDDGYGQVRDDDRGQGHPGKPRRAGFRRLNVRASVASA